MKITNIKESGANNVLMWAISNSADIKSDRSLVSIINDETFYTVTLEDVNFFELFRLTQLYRDKIRIIEEKLYNVPTISELEKIFPGEYSSETETISLAKVAEYAIANFVNIASQMNTDDDIIRPGAARLFLPMITRKFNIQIPVSFVDIIDSMNDEESSKLFNSNYPNTIKEILESNVHGVKTNLYLGFVKHSRILKYNTRYNQYLKLIKYAPIKSYAQSSKLYRFNLIGFHKMDNVNREEIKCSLFNSDINTVSNTLAKLNKLNNPLKLEFAIQLPIHYMQLLENSYSREMLPILYESSMSSIIDGGIVYENFQTPEYIDDEDGKKLENHNNAIDSYRVRIAEANQNLLNAIPIIVKSENDVDITSTFAMLPSIYTTKAVITINMENIEKLLKDPDPVLSGMFKEMHEISKGVIADIKKSN